MAGLQKSPFLLRIKIVSGEGLLGCDKGDVSDPYVKMCQDKEVFFKTTTKDSTVDPLWNEEFGVQLEDISRPFVLQVYDKDNMSFDDFMGQAELNLDQYRNNESFNVTLQLEAANDKKLLKKTKKNEQSLGKINVNIMVLHKDFSPLPQEIQEYGNVENVSSGNRNEEPSRIMEIQTTMENEDAYSVNTANIKNEDDDYFGDEDAYGVKKTGISNEDDDYFGNEDAYGVNNTNITITNITNGSESFVNMNYGESLQSKKEDEDISTACLLKITIISGEDLLPCDKDVSDPYLKMCQDKTVHFKTTSKNSTVNPVWNEGFTVQVDDMTKPFLLQMFDKDKFSFDDFMGQAELELSKYKFDDTIDASFQLEAGNNEKLIEKMKKMKHTLGKLHVNFQLSAIDPVKLQESQKDQSFLKKLTKQFSFEKSSKKQIAIVHVVLVQAQSLAMGQDGTDCDPYCKLSMGNQKHTSKTIKDNNNPKWREEFNFFWYEDSEDFLHIETRHYDDRITKKDEFLGSLSVDLRNFHPELSHNIWRPLLAEKGVSVGALNLILTVTCYTKTDSPSLLTNWSPDPEREAELSEQYNVRNTFNDIKDVGHLTVKVLGAEGLSSTDYNRSADPFAVLELKNARVRTHTINKSLSPEWNQVFQFDVKDMNERLEVTVYDENDNTKEDFLGKVMIPLHRVVDGEKKWFLLKDKRLWHQADGTNPRILLQMNIHWNPVRAAYRTINEAETKYMEKDEATFELGALTYNYHRVKNEIYKVVKWINYFTGRDIDGNKQKLESILNWESKIKSSLVCIAFLVFVWLFEIWMVPFALLFPFLMRFMGFKKSEELTKADQDIDDSERNMNPEDDMSTFAKLKEIGLIAQTNIQYVADLIESVGNVFNFSVPFLSKLAFLALLALTILLFFVPFRICIMCWGLHKLTLRLFLPGHKLFNQSLRNFILSVPNDQMVEWCREIPENSEVNAAHPRDIRRVTRDQTTI